MGAANSKDGDNGTKTLSHPIVQRLFFSDERLLFIFAIYGLAAGLVFAIAGLSEQTSIANAVLYYNYPTLVTLLVVGGAMAGIEPVIQAAMSVLISIGVWTLLPSIFYGIFKMFKVARQMEESQRRL
jgi:hypothetical protein